MNLNLCECENSENLYLIRYHVLTYSAPHTVFLDAVAYTKITKKKKYWVLIGFIINFFKEIIPILLLDVSYILSIFITGLFPPKLFVYT